MGVKGPYAFRRRQGTGYRLYIVNPRSGSSASRTAEKLIKIDGVKEVLVTEGSCGFVVKAGARTEPESRKVCAAIQSSAGGSTKEIIAHYRYRK
jgi:hypothetical protein